MASLLPGYQCDFSLVPWIGVDGWFFLALAGSFWRWLALSGAAGLVAGLAGRSGLPRWKGQSYFRNACREIHRNRRSVLLAQNTVQR
jgi:hypothetical protein